MREFVDWIDVMEADGQVKRCSRTENDDLFENTLGGMGLTGIVLRAAIRLRSVSSGWIIQKTIPAPDLASAMRVFEETRDVGYSVAWIHCLGTGSKLGRSLILVGEHASFEDLPADKKQKPFDIPAKRKLTVPFDFPVFALNRYTIRTLNELYYQLGSRKTKTQIVDWDSYFYPLDAVLKWNRVYGRKGFLQFQCVFPLEQSLDGLTELLEVIAEAGAGSFLAVLKRFGSQESRFSFPMAGYTLALDFPRTDKTLALFKELDAITLAHGGRFYLAKDSRMTAETLLASDNRVADFVQLRDQKGWRSRFLSSQAERLSI
jgi:decaprenylphospho-beta-D-ribofuranose 2-oxidase